MPVLVWVFDDLTNEVVENLKAIDYHIVIVSINDLLKHFSEWFEVVFLDQILDFCKYDSVPRYKLVSIWLLNHVALLLEYTEAKRLSEFFRNVFRLENL